MFGFLKWRRKREYRPGLVWELMQYTQSAYAVLFIHRAYEDFGHDWRQALIALTPEERASWVAKHFPDAAELMNLPANETHRRF